jgi:hypothetical protein
MKKSITLIAALAGLLLYLPESAAQSRRSAQSGKITVRTENYPRPPYSGATYFIYERDGEVICTKLQVASKLGDPWVEYKKGFYKDEEDIRTGEPYGKTDPVVIPAGKLRKHVCLTKFKLLPK